MIIFNSYVSLPEGNIIYHHCGSSHPPRSQGTMVIRGWVRRTAWPSPPSIGWQPWRWCCGCDGWTTRAASTSTPSRRTRTGGPAEWSMLETMGNAPKLGFFDQWIQQDWGKKRCFPNCCFLIFYFLKAPSANPRGSRARGRVECATFWRTLGANWEDGWGNKDDAGTTWCHGSTGVLGFTGLSWWYFGSGISGRHWKIIPTAEWPSEKIPSTTGRAAKIYLVADVDGAAMHLGPLFYVVNLCDDVRVLTSFNLRHISCRWRAVPDCFQKDAFHWRCVSLPQWFGGLRLQRVET